MTTPARPHYTGGKRADLKNYRYDYKPCIGQVSMRHLWILLLLLTACSQVQCDDGCLLDARQCNDIESDTFKDTCFAELALETNNQSMCDSITSIKSNDYCNFNFIKMQTNATACESMNSEYWTQNCYGYYAVNDSSLCDLVKEPGQCYYDHALEQNNSALCYQSNDEVRCIYRVATNTNNVDLCRTIESVNNFSCQIKVAENTNDSDICNELVEPWNEFCLEKIA